MMVSSFRNSTSAVRINLPGHGIQLGAPLICNCDPRSILLNRGGREELHCSLGKRGFLKNDGDIAINAGSRALDIEGLFICKHENIGYNIAVVEGDVSELCEYLKPHTARTIRSGRIV